MFVVSFHQRQLVEEDLGCSKAAVSPSRPALWIVEGATDKQIEKIAHSRKKKQTELINNSFQIMSKSIQHISGRSETIDGFC